MENRTLTTLAQAGVQFLRVLWCDNANVIRGKAIHRKRLASHSDWGVGISAAQQAVPVTIDAPVAGCGLGPVGEVRLIPDWITLKILPYALGHASVVGDMVKDGQPWACCPRHVLKRAIAAASDLGIEVMAAFENEFYLLKSTETELIPADNTLFASTLAMAIQQPVVDAIAEALVYQGVLVEQYYPESGPGQVEISTVYEPALKAADNQIAFRETVRAIALGFDYKASFLPKIFPDQAGSGCHLHLSLWRDQENLLPDPSNNGEISPLARYFVAGILDHLPALMALTTPTPNSYRRLQPHSWSGAFRCWGYDNREAAIRVPTNSELPSPTHIELKTIDASANPYLALGAVIVAGLDGITRQLPLSEPVSIDPGNFSETERQQQGIDRLPIGLGDAIAHLEKDSILLDLLGNELAQAFLAVRKAEWNAMKDWNLEQEVKLLLERY